MFQPAFFLQLSLYRVNCQRKCMHNRLSLSSQDEVHQDQQDFLSFEYKCCIDEYSWIVSTTLNFKLSLQYSILVCTIFLKLKAAWQKKTPQNLGSFYWRFDLGRELLLDPSSPQIYAHLESMQRNIYFHEYPPMKLTLLHWPPMVQWMGKEPKTPKTFLFIPSSGEADSFYCTGSLTGGGVAREARAVTLPWVNLSLPDPLRSCLSTHCAVCAWRPVFPPSFPLGQARDQDVFIHSFTHSFSL